jgi:hypothetical protein
MKKSLLFFAFIIGSLNIDAQTVYPAGVTGCIARWDFANTGGPIASLPDVSGNGNNSSAVNALTAAQGFRNAPNKAMSFNGFSSSATVPHAAILQPAALTMVAVVRMNNFYTGNCQETQIISKAYPQTTSGHYGLTFTDDIWDNNCGAYSATHQQLKALFGPTTTVPIAGKYATTNQWYFVAASYDGTSTIKYYQVPMDPLTYVSSVTPISTLANTTAIGSNTQPVSIGRYLNPPYPFWFNGSMDEIVLFNKALTATEIQSVYDYLWGIVKITSITKSTLCGGDTFTVNYSVNNSSFFAATNTFSVQMSNATGSFATPTVVGSTVATGGGAISCTAPTTLPIGTGYRFRIVANNVAYTTADNGSNISLTTIAKPAAGSNAPVCVGQTLNLTGSTSTPGVTYNWSGPGFTSSSQNPSIPNVSAVNAGNYILSATLNGCISQADTEAVVIGSNLLPSVTNYVSPDDSICTGATVAFLALVINGGTNPQYQWKKNGIAIPGETNNSFYSQVLSTGDVINCEVTAAGCNVTNTVTSNSFTMAVLANGPAAVGITADPGPELSPWQTVIFTAHPTNGGSNPAYQWKRNGTNVIGATGVTWSVNNLDNNDTITVALTGTSPCATPQSAISGTFVVKIKTSVDNIDPGNTISLYPNPNNGAFTIDGYIKSGGAVAIEILNVTGQVVYSENIKLHTPDLHKNITLSSSLPGGIYILKLKTDGMNKVARFNINK